MQDHRLWNAECIRTSCMREIHKIVRKTVALFNAMSDTDSSTKPSYDKIQGSPVFHTSNFFQFFQHSSVGLWRFNGFCGTSSHIDCKSFFSSSMEFGLN